LHYFPYRDEYHRQEKDRQTNLTTKLALDEEFKVLGKLGVRKKEDMTNYGLLSSFSKEYKI